MNNGKDLFGGLLLTVRTNPSYFSVLRIEQTMAMICQRSYPSLIYAQPYAKG